MKSITASILAITLFALLALTAQAAPNPLIEQGDRIRAIVKTLPTNSVPADWHFIVVNEMQWKEIAPTRGHDFPSRSAVSNLGAHFTFIREGYAVSATDYDLRKSIAHEMGHRICNCQDENKANAYQDQILKQGPR